MFAHFWLHLGRRLWRPHLYCLHSRFTIVWSLSWVLGLCGVCPGCCCVGDDRLDDYSADSSASLAQCCRCGGFFPPVSRFFALVWGLLLFLRNFRFYSLATLMVYPFLLRLSILRFSLSYYSWPCVFWLRPPSQVVPIFVCGVSFFL